MSTSWRRVNSDDILVSNEASDSASESARSNRVSAASASRLELAKLRSGDFTSRGGLSTFRFGVRQGYVSILPSGAQTIGLVGGHTHGHRQICGAPSSKVQVIAFQGFNGKLDPRAGVGVHCTTHA